jgi:hypothetical protein
MRAEPPFPTYRPRSARPLLLRAACAAVSLLAMGMGAVSARAEGPRELIYVSDESLQGLIGCSWGGYCAPKPGLKVRVDSNRLLFAVFWTRPNGVEEELRPMFYPPSPHTLDEYRRIDFRSEDKNFSFTDISRCANRHVASDRLFGLYRVRWGADFATISKSDLLKGYRFEDPRRFFDGAVFEVRNDEGEPRLHRDRKPGSWYLPEWVASFSPSKATESAWPPQDDRGKTCYLLLRDDGRAVRVLELESQDGSPAGLFRIYEYGPSVTLTVFQPVDEGRDSPVPFASGVLQSLREEEDQSSAPILSDLPEIGWGAAPPEEWSGPRVAVNPYEFFLAQGHAFEDWRLRFFKAKRQGGYSASPDHSWMDERGNKLYLVAEPLWSNWRILTPRPRWYVLEYRPRANKTFGLSRVYAYDERWTESVWVPPRTPVLPGAPPERSWWQENSHKSKRIALEILAVMIAGGAGLLYIRKS